MEVSSSYYASSSSSEFPDDDPEADSPVKNLEEKLLVAVRVRPLRDGEGDRSLHCVDEKTILVEGDKNDVLRQKRGSERKYVFDMAFGEDSTQEQVYVATTRGLVRDVLKGYNATVFAYGATGAGKTHTMAGSSQEPGVMVRALNDLFHSIDKHGQNYTVSLSYLEIYNENIRDLLNPSSGALELREDSRGRNIVVAGLTEITANSTQEVMALLQRGNKSRTVEPTAANQTSSRSHALMSVIVRRTSQTRDQYRTRMRQGRLYMLDLAGSERASQTKNRGKRLLEGAHINRSLLALGNVINSLSGSGGGRYVNYRDSKLTRLLREALSGNCRTVMVAHVSPAAAHREETRNTLTYAARACGISHNKVERNVLDVSFHVSQYRNIIQDLRGEIARLKDKLGEDRPVSAGIGRNAAVSQAKQLREMIVSTFRDQMKLRRRLMDIDGHLLSLGVEAERQHQIISQWESRSNKLYHRKSRPGTDQSDTNGNLTGDPWNEVNMHQAWSELSYIEREQERYMALRSATLRELEQCRQRAVQLENELPSRLDSDTERELLSLLCRVHELEADKMALQGERLVETHELRRRGELIQKYNRQQRITDDIITRQRQLMEEVKVVLPNDLQDLYYLYQQEIHAATLNPDGPGFDSLPPINRESLFDRSRVGTAAETDLNIQTPTSNSTSGGEWEPLPPLQPRDSVPHPRPLETPSLPPLRP